MGNAALDPGGPGDQAADFDCRWRVHADNMTDFFCPRKASDRRLVRPTLRGALLGLEIGASPRH
jgi:hypothetical protein